MTSSRQQSRRAACTIIARNYLSRARALGNSYLEHDPEGRFFVLVVDGLPAGLEIEPRIEVLEPADLGIPEFLEMAFKYDVTELCTAVKPALLAFILEAHGVEQLVYFDPDIMIFRPLDEMWHSLEAANIVLIPHLLDPIPLDGCRPSEQEILIAGAYNLGFIGVRRSDETRRMLDWWHERLRDHCRVDVAHGLFVDQKWMDLTPSLFTPTAILRESSYDVAYWNLHSRHLEHRGETVLVDGCPLAFFHYSGFDPAHPRVLSKHQNRLSVGEGSPLASLLDTYGHALQGLGFALTGDWKYGHATFDNGFPISGLHRHLYASLAAEERTRFGNPFQTAGAESFFHWSSRPGGGPGGLSPFLEFMLAESLEARVAFPDAHGRHQKAFLAWAQVHGVERFGFDPRLADPSAWSSLAMLPPMRDGLVDGLGGVNVYGYLSNETGIGAVARGYVRALRGLGVPLGLTDLAELSPNRSQDTSLGRIDGSAPHAINLVCVNADQHFVVKSHVGADAFANHYNIGVWFWELPSFPEAWTDRFLEYDEIWAPTSFIANTLAAISPVPIVRMPPVLATTQPGSRDAGRRRLGFADGTFVVLLIFDFASFFERKNPLGLIEAFKQAFEPEEDVRLVIKCVNEHLDAPAFAAMQAASAGLPVSVYSGYWAAEDMHDLMHACDAYASLHRSEGLGLPLADAMALGKPVVATAWSGNTEFMTVANSFPVPFDLVELEQDVGPYRAGSVWAEPSAAEAARLLRLVRDEPAMAGARAAMGKRDLEERYSEQAVARLMQQRLALAASKRRRSRTSMSLVPVAPERSLLSSAPDVPPMELAGSSHGRAGVLMKRAMNFLMRYQTHYQGEINLQFAAFMRTLAAEHEALTAEVKSLAPRQQVADLERHVQGSDEILSVVANDLARHETYFSARPYMATNEYGTDGDLVEPMGFGLNGDVRAPGASAPDFADLFRGPERFIADRQRAYVRFFEGASDVVDLGAGRGEFLDVLREHGVDAVGVEVDPAMVEHCRARGLRAELADAYDYLYSLPEASVDVIFSAQFIEHVESARLPELVELARSRLRERGLFIAETVNPESHLAQKAFFVDLTHQRPIFPQVILHICQTAGFQSGRIFYPTAGGFTQMAFRDAGEYAVIAVK